MKLSIITINLNNALGLRKTIESVVNQTSNDYEYLIIDGGSIDSSIDVIKEYEDKIRYWINEPDTGIYNAMNKGIKMANGEYCQFLNSGDYLVNENVIERMLKDIPECGILYGNLIKKMQKGRLFYNKKVPIDSLLTFYNGTLNHSSCYINRNLFEKYGYYDESLKIVSDWKFFFVTVCLNNEPVVYTDVDVTYFDMNGVSNTNNLLEKEERFRVLKELLPANILADYQRYGNYVVQMKRIRRYKLTKWIIWFIDRFLFKLEKLETKIKKEQLFYTLF